MGRVVSWRLGCVSGSVFVLLFSILGAPARVMSGFFQICFSMRDTCFICFFLLVIFLVCSRFNVYSDMALFDVFFTF
jgi:hypothetical protein